jgi:hypothetical protein
LFLGTHAENMRDMASKGRSNKIGFKNEAHPMCKLSDKDVEIIRGTPKVRGDSKILGKQFNIDSSVIRKIRNNQLRKN